MCALLPAESRQWGANSVGLDLITELLQPLAQLVLVAAQCIVADVALLWVLLGAGKGRLGRQIVHAHADHPQGGR